MSFLMQGSAVNGFCLLGRKWGGIIFVWGERKWDGKKFFVSVGGKWEGRIEFCQCGIGNGKEAQK